MTYSRSHSQCIARSEVKMQLCLITCCFPVSTGLCSINICCTSHHIKLLGMLSRKRYTVRPWSKELINPVILNVFSIEQQSLKKCWELCCNKRARTHYRLLVTLITSWMLCMGKTWKLVGFPVWRGGIGGFVGFVQCVLRTFQSPEAAALVFLELGKDNSQWEGGFQFLPALWLAAYWNHTSAGIQYWHLQLLQFFFQGSAANSHLLLFPLSSSLPLLIFF